MTSAQPLRLRSRTAELGSRLLRVLTMATILVVSISGQPLVAQVTTSTDGRTVVPRDTADAARHQTLFTYRDAALAAGFVGLTFAMFPADRQIARQLQDESLQANQFFRRSANGLEVISTPGSYFIGGGLYAFGRVMGHKDVADLGWHGTEAVLLSSGVTGMLKGILGRARPDFVADTNPRDFQFGRGFGKSARQSFPSGHTTTAFAAAAAVTSEARRMWPKSVWFVAPAMYGGATLVGLSRMYHNRHWASDVVLGAAVGTFSGLKVVRYSHAHPDNRIDRMILSASVMPDGRGGGVLSFSVPAP